MSLNEIVKTMQDAVNRQAEQATPGGYDTTATVRRIEDGTAWVHIPGGVDETPVKLTINAKVGDNVQVRVSGGNAFLVGNGSAPPTDDARANQAYTVATVAEGAAENALANAARAAEAADSAQASATRAESAAGDAVIAAGDAQTAAGNAQTAADTALVNLATTEDVVGVLNWITAHGTMTTQSGGVFVPGQVYFISDPAGDYVVGGNHYSVVPEPKAADIDSYYVLTVDESVQNYVATHIVVDSEGLWIIPDAGGNKVLIAVGGAGHTYTTAGTYIVGKVGGVDTVLASFTASGATIGKAAGAHTSIDEDGMQIYSVDSLDNVVNLANIGYGEGTTSSGSQGTAPFYTFGKRKQASNAYDSTQTYDVGDLVLYGNPQKEYCCKVAIETPEAWTSSHWKLSIGNYSIAGGNSAIASGYASRAEGHSVTAVGEASHAEGRLSISIGDASHAEGNNTKAIGDYGAHAEGFDTKANGSASHAEGQFTHANGANSHAEGQQTTAGWSAHAEGYLTTATSEAHSEGHMTTASGRYSHAQNFGTISSKYAQTALGTYNEEDTSSTTTHPSDDEVFGQYAVIVGNGEDDDSRSNALTVDWSGNVEAAGDVTDGAGNVLANKRSAAWVQMYHGNRAMNNTAAKITGLTISKGGNYNEYFNVGTADQVTIKKTGGYRIDMAMRFSSVTNAANVKRISLYVNGSEFLVLMARANSWEDFSTFYTQTLSVGDVLTMYGRSEDGNATASIERIYITPIVY